ncbi:cadherin domain protein [Cooperia oncophora]
MTPRVVLKVSVKDTNNHSPEFDSPWYTFTVDEGKIHEEIAVLKATDADCGNPYGQICDFEIANGLNDFPFSINNQGVLRNTKPLNYTAAKSYILTVVAIDCGMRRSKSALVTVNVKETCVQGHTGITDRLSYMAGNGPKLVLPNVQAHICAQKSACDVKSIHSTVKLQAGHVTEGCSRDTLFNNETFERYGIVTISHSVGS